LFGKNGPPFCRSADAVKSAAIHKRRSKEKNSRTGDSKEKYVNTAVSPLGALPMGSEKEENQKVYVGKLRRTPKSDTKEKRIVGPKKVRIRKEGWSMRGPGRLPMGTMEERGKQAGYIPTIKRIGLRRPQRFGKLSGKAISPALR